MRSQTDGSIYICVDREGVICSHPLLSTMARGSPSPSSSSVRALEEWRAVSRLRRVRSIPRQAPCFRLGPAQPSRDEKESAFIEAHWARASVGICSKRPELASHVHACGYRNVFQRHPQLLGSSLSITVLNNQQHHQNTSPGQRFTLPAVRTDILHPCDE